MRASLIKQYQEYTDLQRQLMDLNITLDKISEESGVSKATVSRVLHKDKIDTCTFGKIKAVRQAIKQLAPSFANISFDEYDEVGA